MVVEDILAAVAECKLVAEGMVAAAEDTLVAAEDIPVVVEGILAVAAEGKLAAVERFYFLGSGLYFVVALSLRYQQN